MRGSNIVVEFVSFSETPTSCRERFIIAWVNTRRQSTREESAGFYILAMKTTARAVVGRGEKILLSDPRSE